MKNLTLRLALAAILLTSALHAQVPQLVNYQGRVAVDAVNFEGAGLFRFALVNEDGTITFWSNDGTSAAGSEPTDAVSLAVAKGLYSVLLGDLALVNMTAIPASVFTNPDVRLRVWFDDGLNGSQLLTPDQRLAPATYVADGAVTSASIAAGAVMGTHVAPGALDFSHLTVPAVPGTGQVLSFDGVSLNWVTPGASDGIWALNGTSAFYNAGSVGIGSSAPAAPLEVNGVLRSTRLGVAPQYIQINGGDSGSIKLTAQSVAAAEKNLFMENLSGEAVPGLNNNIQFVLGTTAAPSTKMIIAGNGGVGLGTLAPQTRLHLKDASASISQRIETSGGTNAWTRVEFLNGNGLWNVGTSRSFNGDEFYFYRQGAAVNAFAIQPNGDAFLQGSMSCKTLTIRGGADLAEPFAMSERGVAAGSVVVIDPAQPGRLKRSAQAYDKKVAGIVSGANGIHPGISMIDEQQLEPGSNVALSGRVYVKANTSAGKIEPGDLLTTSDVPGEAMKAADHARGQGSILGKAMTPLDEATGTVLVLVTLQ